MSLPTPICPNCRTPISAAPSCKGCGRPIPSLRGIVDLRATEDGFLSNADDNILASRLDAAYQDLDFTGLLDRYFDLAEIPSSFRPGQIAHILGGAGRARSWLREIPADGPILDLGCGSGSFAVEVGPERDVVGVDIALRWLLVARKRLDESGLSGVPLVCGSAERLPWPDETFSAIVAGDVIEHVDDQGATLSEAFRLLRPGGSLIMNTPNRFSLGLEPHVGLWGVGFLPRRLMSRYVQARGRGDFRAIRTLGLDEWKRLLLRSPFRGGEIAVPTIDAPEFTPGVKRRLISGYNLMLSHTAGRAIARRVGPLFQIVCRKPVR